MYIYIRLGTRTCIQVKSTCMSKRMGVNWCRFRCDEWHANVLILALE